MRSRPLIQRDAGNDRDQDRRHRRDHREQADNADVQLGGCAAAPARLDDHPDLAPDNADEEQRRQRIRQQEADHDLVRRDDPGEPGQHHESQERGKERDADGDRSEPSNPRPRTLRGACQYLCGNCLVGAHR